LATLNFDIFQKKTTKNDYWLAFCGWVCSQLLHPSNRVARVNPSNLVICYQDIPSHPICGENLYVILDGRKCACGEGNRCYLFPGGPIGWDPPPWVAHEKGNSPAPGFALVCPWGRGFVVAQCGSGVSSPGAEHEDGREGEVHGACVRVLCAVLLRVVTAGDCGE